MSTGQPNTELELIKHQDSRFIVDLSVRYSVASSGDRVLYEKSKRKDSDELLWPVTSSLGIAFSLFFLLVVLSHLLDTNNSLQVFDF